MKINSIQNYSLNYNKYRNNNKNKNNIYQNPNYQTLPSTMQYLSFTGGYSLSLVQTVKQLDKLAEKTEGIYPKNIREWLGAFLETGNKNNDTLITVHKNYFKSLEDCFSIEDIKAKFPEFADIESAFDYFPKEGSFIDRFQKGELEYFDNDEDLTVQLIKLYWGKGFSLNDLKQYANGQNLYYAMSALHIPTASRDYGHILKFSDPKYNERLTSEMAEKLRGRLDRLAQQRDGEPVYIPNHRKHTPEQRQRISEGLKKYYEENPLAIFEMSERQKKFYRDNPNKAKELKRALDIAWNLESSKKIRRAMSKFFTGKGIKDFDPTQNPIELNKERSKLMNIFWSGNEWAKKSFSKGLKYGFKKVREQNQVVYTLRVVPEKLLNFAEAKAGLPKGSLDATSKYNPYLGTSSINEEAYKIFQQHTNIKELGDVMADTYQLTTLFLVNKLKDTRFTSKNMYLKKFRDLAITIINSNTTKTDGEKYITQTIEEARNDYVLLARYAAESKYSEALSDLLYESLNEAYDYSLGFHNLILK